MEKRSIRGLMEKLSMSPGGSPCGPTKKPSPFGGLRVFFLSLDYIFCETPEGCGETSLVIQSKTQGCSKQGCLPGMSKNFCFQLCLCTCVLCDWLFAVSLLRLIWAMAEVLKDCLIRFRNTNAVATNPIIHSGACS